MGKFFRAFRGTCVEENGFRHNIRVYRCFQNESNTCNVNYLSARQQSQNFSCATRPPRIPSFGRYKRNFFSDESVGDFRRSSSGTTQMSSKFYVPARPVAVSSFGRQKISTVFAEQHTGSECASIGHRSHVPGIEANAGGTSTESVR